MNQTPLPFNAGMAIADCAAQVFADNCPAKYPECPVKALAYGRYWAVKALRHLWQSGDADQRATVAARVAVWMDRPVKEIGPRVLARERARLGSV